MIAAVTTTLTTNCIRASSSPKNSEVPNSPVSSTWPVAGSIAASVPATTATRMVPRTTITTTMASATSTSGPRFSRNFF